MEEEEEEEEAEEENAPASEAEKYSPCPGSPISPYTARRTALQALNGVEQTVSEVPFVGLIWNRSLYSDARKDIASDVPIS